MKIACPGVSVATGVNGEPLCLDSGGSPVAWEAVPEFEVSSLDIAQLSGAYAAGFVLIATGWAIGRGFKFVLSMIR